MENRIPSPSRPFHSTWRFTDAYLRALEESGKSLADIRQIVLPMSGDEPSSGVELNGVTYYNDSTTPARTALKRQRIQELVNASAQERQDVTRTGHAMQARLEAAVAASRQWRARKRMVGLQHDYVMTAAKRFGIKRVTCKPSEAGWAEMPGRVVDDEDGDGGGAEGGGRRAQDVDGGRDGEARTPEKDGERRGVVVKPEPKDDKMPWGKVAAITSLSEVRAKNFATLFKSEDDDDDEHTPKKQKH